MIIEAEIGGTTRKLELPDGSSATQIDDAINHFSGSQSKGFGERFMDNASDYGAALKQGITAIPLGLMQGESELASKASNAVGAPETAAKFQRTADMMRGVAAEQQGKVNSVTERNPVLGTIGSMAPQLGQVLGYGMSLPGIVAGGATIGGLSPKFTAEDMENMPKGETALTRLLEPVAKGTTGTLEALGVNPESRGGKALAQGALAGLTYGAGKPIGYAVGKAAQGANSVAKGAVRQATKLNSEAIDALTQSGIAPTLQLAGDSWVTRSLSNTLSKVPVIGKRLNNNYSNALTKLEGNLENSASKLGPAADAIEGGEALQKGLRSFQDKTGARIDDLYNNQLPKVLPGDTPAALDATRDFAGQYMGKYARTPNVGENLRVPGVTNKLGAIVKDANKIDFDTLKSIRTDIGAETRAPNAPAAYKQMYRALSQDMQATANATSPEAARKLAAANRYTRMSKGTQQKLQRFFTENQDGSFKMAPEAATGASRQELELLKRSIPKEDFNNFSAATLRELGRATPGAQNATGELFSANTFLTNWNKLGAKKNILFTDKQLGKELDRSATVASRFKELSKAANYSNTTNNLMTAGSFAALFLEPTSAATLGGLAYGGARLMTSPKALKVINDYAYRPVLKNPKVQTQFSKQLIRAAGQDPELQKEIGIYLDGIKRASIAPERRIPEPQMMQLPQGNIEALRRVGGNI